MKNIEIVDVESYTSFKNCKFVIEAEGKGTILVYNDEEGVLYESNKGDSDTQLVKLHNIPNVIDIKYLANRDTVFFQVKSNIIETFEVPTQYKKTYQVNSERECVCGWSPNQEVLVVADGSQITILDTQLNVIGEHSLGDTSFGEFSFVSVGWGTKETQFKGAAGKLTKTETKSDVPLDTDTTVQVSWRGDSEYFAVIFNEKGQRIFKVFDKYCVLQSTSDRNHHLGAALSWRPSGNWIAAPIKENGVQQIGLFEKNGLHFRTITLDLNIEVVNLEWSHDSNLLTVETVENGVSYLKTYTKNNNHWYLKQTLAFSTAIASFNWAYNDLSLSIHLKNGQFFIYKFNFTTNYFCNEEMSIVCVIDNTKILLSDFAQGIIPPPYSHSQIESMSSVNLVGFLTNTNENEEIDMFSMDQQFVISTYKCKRSDDGVEIAECGKFVNDSNKDSLHLMRNWIWLTSNLMTSISENKVYFWKLFDQKFTLESTKEFDNRILDANCFQNGELIIELSTGKTVFLNKETESNFIMLPEACERIESFMYNDKVHLISFRQLSGTLYFDDNLLQSNVTSFMYFSHFILFTTNDLLWVYDLRSNSIVDQRAIEFMSQIIVGVPNKLIVVLQMTRGNLEAIRPRALTICGVCEQIKSKHYDKAFKMALMDRINLNILIDYDLQHFLDDLELFVDSLKPKALNLLILDITDADVTKTMYQSYFVERRDYPENFDAESKIQVVCRNVLELLVSRNNTNELTLPIISVLVKMGNIESALRWMWRHTEKMEALDILTNMIDLNRLYIIALGMYNIQICVFLAERSQMDPKEYLPFLNRLSHYKDQSYRYYQIDLHLKRYEKALSHIAACGDEYLEECFGLITKFNLHSIALRIFEDKNDFCKRIALSFGDFLKMNGKLLEASLMFERGQDLQQAIDMAVAVQDGERCLTLSELLYGDDIESIRKIGLKMIDQLTSNNKWVEASEIAFKYLEDYELGIRCLILGDMFLNAIKMCRQWKVPLETLELRIVTYSQDQLKRIESYSEHFIKMKRRLGVVRIQKENKTDDFYNLEECDVLSDRSSVSSFSKSSNSNSLSKKSFRSAKKFRKHERKVFCLKEGSPYEEIAIIDLLYRIVDDVQKIVRPIRDVNMAIIELHMYSVGVKLQDALRNLLKLVEQSLDDIWLPDMTCMSVDIELPAQIAANQRYKLLDPVKRLKPPFLVKNDWEFEILK